MAPGEMVWYESARLSHGRSVPSLRPLIQQCITNIWLVLYPQTFKSWRSPLSSHSCLLDISFIHCLSQIWRKYFNKIHSIRILLNKIAFFLKHLTNEWRITFSGWRTSRESSLTTFSYTIDPRDLGTQVIIKWIQKTI